MGTLVKTVVVILSIAGFVSCSKNKSDDPAPPDPPLVQINPKGYWTGVYTTAGSLNEEKNGILIKEGGIARLYVLDASTDTTLISPLSKTNGTWVMNGSTLQLSYTSAGAHFTTSTTINNAATTMIGTWSKDGIVKGTVSMTK